MAASSPTPCTSIQNQRHVQESNFSTTSIGWQKGDKNQPTRKYFGIQSVNTRSLQGIDCGKNNGLEIADKSEIEACSSVKDEIFVGFFREAWPYFWLIEAALSSFWFLLKLSIALIWIIFSWISLSFMGWESNSFLFQGRMFKSTGFSPKEGLNQSTLVAIELPILILLERQWMLQEGFILIEAKLSPGPSLSSVRRHGDNHRWHNGVCVAGGNFLAAKRRGVVEGIDYASTGEVKKIDVARMQERLDQDCIVILSNLGYSSSGEVLNCKYGILILIGILLVLTGCVS